MTKTVPTSGFYPAALTIAGSDCSAGAGIQADLKTFSALGVYGATVITAITAQNTLGISSLHCLASDLVTAQLTALLNDFSFTAGKIGMLGSAAIAQAVADSIEQVGFPVVLDTPLSSGGGESLLDKDGVEVLRRRLMPLVSLTTPNIPEAALLLGADEQAVAEDPAGAALELCKQGAKAALVTGGHSEGEEVTDVLAAEGKIKKFSRRRVHSTNTHGSGCTLSAAIAAQLARGETLADAVLQAGDYVHAAIAAAAGYTLGSGPGPLEHFFLQRGQQH